MQSSSLLNTQLPVYTRCRAARKTNFHVVLPRHKNHCSQEPTRPFSEWLAISQTVLPPATSGRTHHPYLHLLTNGVRLTCAQDRSTIYGPFRTAIVRVTFFPSSRLFRPLNKNRCGTCRGANRPIEQPVNCAQVQRYTDIVGKKSKQINVSNAGWNRVDESRSNNDMLARWTAHRLIRRAQVAWRNTREKVMRFPSRPHDGRRF